MDELKGFTPTVLVPIDGSVYAEQAIPFARAIGGPGAKLVLLRVIPNPEALRGLWGAVVATEAQVMTMSRESAEGELAQAVADWSLPDEPISSEVVEGDPAIAILDRARAHDADFVVIASHGRGAVGRWTFGSVADHVARSAPMPVLIVCPTEGGADPRHAEVTRIVAPLDGSEISMRSLPVAESAARRLNVPLLLVQVINPSSMLVPATYGVPVHDRAAQDLVDTQVEAARKLLAETAAQAEKTGCEVSTALELGATVDGIEAVLKPGDLIVMSSHGRGGVRRWLLGSVAERLVRDGQTPVLLVPAAERQHLIERQQTAAHTDTPSA